MRTPPSRLLVTCSASQILWNRKFHYCVHRGLPLVCNLSQMHPAHIFTTRFFKIHCVFILPSAYVKVSSTSQTKYFEHTVKLDMTLQ
jgi:hypothetical protein